MDANELAGIEPKFNFFDGSDDQNIGDQLIDFNASGTNSAENGEADSEVGANFDVVVHIHSEWCNSPSFWNVADMQLLGDFNNGNPDYPLNSQPFTAQASRTDLLYSDAQIDPLPMKTAFDLIGTKNTEQTASESLFTSTTNADACYLAASSCTAQMDTYFEKAKLAATCAENLLTQADCGDEDTEETDAKALYYTCLSGLLPGIAGVCTDDTVSSFDEIEVLAGLSQAWGSDVGEYINAVNAYNDDLANSFTHAHTDLMDKRHDEVASYNNVYQKDGNGYLQFPNANDDAFKGIDGNPDANLYTASASYLRWPNAGAFAAFYSFVACANPPYISGDAAVKAEVNYYSIIYNNGVNTNDVGDPTSAETAYSYLGETILRSRTLVMSQSDSDYRDESCQNREFRANVRQVGNSVTHCGPGQLPDTDNKRCSWNWNYNSHSHTGDNDTHNGNTANDTPAGKAWNSPSDRNAGTLDAEEWFDRNDPHSFDMWSTRKRRAVANNRKYGFNMGYWGVQEDATGDSQNMFDGEVFNSENQFHANAIQIPITDFNFNLIFKNADDEVPPMTVEINTDFCFSPSNAAGCTACMPSATEFNQAGFVDQNGDAVTISAVDAVQKAADVAALSSIVGGFFHVTACGGTPATIDGTAYKTCTPAEISLMQATTHLGSTTVCDSNNGNSYKAENGKGGFRQLTNAQTLTFDDPRIKSALNPTSKKWEVSVQCEKVNMQTLSNTQAQRDYFPECFFGDEIWFTFTYGSDLIGAYPASPAISTPHNLSYNTYVSAWFSSVEVQQTPEYISASQLLSAN